MPSAVWNAASSTRHELSLLDGARKNSARFRRFEQVYIVRLIQLLLVAFCLGTLFVKPRMSTTTLQVRSHWRAASYACEFAAFPEPVTVC